MNRADSIKVTARRLYPAIVLILIGLSGCEHFTDPVPPKPPVIKVKSTISIAAASDLKFALDDLISEFNSVHPEIAITPVYGSSGQFYTQLSQDAPFDIFLSADVSYPRQLIEQAKASSDSEFIYGLGRIVLWVREDSRINLEREGIAALKHPSVQKIAIANPQHAPYGRAAEAALKYFEVYDVHKDQLVMGENIAQAAQFVETGAADIGIIAASLATSAPLREKGRIWPFPSNSYPKMEQAGIILNSTREREACETFRNFMIAKPGREILQRYGFSF